MAIKKFFRTAQIELDLYATLDEVAEINASQIAEFKDTYWAHTDTRLDIHDSLSEAWIQTVARLAATAKTPLRVLLRHSQYWNENIQACELPISRTWEPNPNKVHELIRCTWESSGTFWRTSVISYGTREHLENAMHWLANPDADQNHEDFESIQQLLPRKFWRKKKITIFVKISEFHGLHTTDAYKHNLEEISFWLNGVDKSYTLYVSLNPAHFLSASNPCDDKRGEAMTSCHSFNHNYYLRNEHGNPLPYPTRSGCVGYACDKVTMVAFIADKGKSMLNRKKARQLFHYANGALIQSRLYTSEAGAYGGIHDAKEFWQSKTFRQAVQNLLAQCLGVTPHWQTKNYLDKHYQLNSYGIEGYKHYKFCGYPDWRHFGNTGLVKASRLTPLKKEVNYCEPFTIGEAYIDPEDFQ